VSAQVVISEIMYDVSGTDTDREWVEVFNAGGTSVHFTDWKLFEANTNHNVAAVQGGENLASGAYAIIADSPTKFLQDWPSYSGILFDSAFSLGNSGETLAIHMPPPELTETDSVTYQGAGGAAGNGNSLHRTSASGQGFNEGSPTPGTGSLSVTGSGDPTPSPDPVPATSTEQNVNASNSSSDSVMPPPPKLFADGGSNRTVIVGADTEFKARAYDEKKNLIDFSRFHWNFGDGSVSDVATILHRFEYPGRYVVVLDMPEEKDAVPDQIIVTVEQMKLALSLMQDGGVTIENRAGRTLDLSRWIIRSMERTFTIPERTFILAGSSLRISPRTLGFSSGADVELAYPNGAAAVSTAPTPAPTSTPPAPLPAVVPRAQNRGENPGGASRAFVSDEESVPAEELEIVASTTLEESTQAAGAAAGLSGMSPKWWFGALGIAGLAAGSLALARRYGRKEWDIIEENPK